jgi:hypothetical protein
VGGGQGSKRAERSQETKSSEDGEVEEPAFTQQTKRKSQRKRREMLQNRKENLEKELGKGEEDGNPALTKEAEITHLETCDNFLRKGESFSY